MTGFITNRRGGAAHTRLALFDVERKTFTLHVFEGLDQPFLIDDGSLGAGVETRTGRHAAQEAGPHGLPRAAHKNLPQRGAVHREPITDPQAGQQDAVRLNSIEVNHLFIPEHRQMCGLARFQREFLQHRPGTLEQAMPSNEALSQLEAPRTQAIALGLGALLDIAVLFESREESKDVVLVQAKPPGEFTDPEFIRLLERLEHAQRIAHGLNRIIALRFRRHG